jgi:putative endonuclease
MSNHIATGNAGEAHAVLYLEHKGFIILERNWRSKRNEIDVIASKGNTLHFIEVKTRTSSSFAPPETKVNTPKLKHMKEAAEVYLQLNPQWKFIQFDIISVYLKTDGAANIYTIEDVF